MTVGIMQKYDTEAQEMTELTLCMGLLSTTPYYIVGLGINIYSIEELCFCLVQNAYILDRDLMDEKLCVFLEKQLKMTELSEKLKKLIDEEKSLGEFVTTILDEVFYCDEEEIKHVKQVLVDNASLGFAQKRKARGDNLLKAKKYTLAIDEYQYVLQCIKKEEEPELYAAILHNTGVAYAQLFLFEKAAGYYQEAVEMAGSRESLIQYLMAVRMTMRREQYERMLLRYGYEDAVVKEAEERMNTYRNAKPESSYAKSLEQIRELQSNGKVSAYYCRIDDTLNIWKQEYRKNMIVRSR
ncbi:MAG TPA: tetratricopeptide repeat protein [Lachnospiraceae bacterium]|nr:tetratricopeptide repeat protein [Lachnospiraceae bacterium]